MCPRYGNDEFINMTFHGPYLDKAFCKMWTSQESIFDELLSFKMVKIIDFSGMGIQYSHIVVVFGYCECVNLSTLRGFSLL